MLSTFSRQAARSRVRFHGSISQSAILVSGHRSVLDVPSASTFYLHRFYSTPGPSVDSTRSSRSDDTLAAATPKKTKVALHPAPMKPSRETTGKPKKAVQSTKKLAGSSITPPAAHVPARPTPEDDAALHMKVSTSSEEDMKDAYRHGILRPPPEGAGVLKRSLHTLIELGKFYYRGIKMVAVTNRREAKAILQRVSDGGSAFTRAETRFLWTQESDMSRVIPFTIIALTIEELIPLIVLFAPGMLPSTCILPSQRKRIDTKAEAEAILAWKDGYRVFKHLKQASLSSRLVSLEEVLGLGGAAKYLVKLLRLSDRPLDFWRIFQLRDHLQHLAMDDQLLLNEGILTKKTLTTTEVDAALEERGFILRSVPAERRLQVLRSWLKAAQLSDGHSAEDELSRRIFLIIDNHS